MLATGGAVEPGILATHARLMAHARGELNDHDLACMLASWRHGGGNMPNRLGLSEAWFRTLLAHHFPGTDVDFPALGPVVDLYRTAELADLRSLLLRHRAQENASEAWLAEMIAVGCLGDGHLWRALGLWSRRDLSELMRRNFPTLAARNDRDMKWKKFLYKQLCESEGIYVCRAPSCEQCVDYGECFALDEPYTYP